MRDKQLSFAIVCARVCDCVCVRVYAYKSDVTCTCFWDFHIWKFIFSVGVWNCLWAAIIVDALVKLSYCFISHISFALFLAVFLNEHLVFMIYVLIYKKKIRSIQKPHQSIWYTAKHKIILPHKHKHAHARAIHHFIGNLST